MEINICVILKTFGHDCRPQSCVCFVFTESNDAEVNVDVGKSDDSDEGSNDYVNTKGMAHVGTLNRI